MRKLVAVALAVVPLVGCYTPGLVSTADHAKSATAAGSLGARVCRVEFTIGSSAASLDSSVDAFADRGCRVLILAGFPDGQLPTTAESQSLSTWASRFGPGGSFWAGRTELAVTDIEFGNETSYCYQFPVNCGGAWYNEPSYKTRAATYADRLAAARQAIDLTGKAVGLIAQADDGGSGSASWVDSMFFAQPGLASKVSGWSVHPYGPSPTAKIGRLVSQVGARGGGNVPVDVTEYGIATDNGANLNDNYGWPVNLTFAQAATDLDQAVSAMRGYLADRLRYMTIFAAHDRDDPGTGQREGFFGGLRKNLAEKGAYSAEVRDQLDE